MECKVQKHPVIVFDNEGGASDVDGTCTSCSRCGSKFVTWTNLTLLFVLFMSNTFLHYKCMAISNELSELKQSQTRSVPPLASHLTSSLQDFTSDPSHDNSERRLTKRNYRQARRQRRATIQQLERKTQRNRVALERILSRPAIHLRGSDSQTSVAIAQNSIFSGSVVFRWEHMDPNDMNSAFRYVTDTQDSTRIIGVNITNPGLYLIYSQVMINGPFNDFDPAYGLQTVRHKSSHDDVLLMSYLTQDGRGAVYPQRYGDTEVRHPVDFISHMGMFELECGDIIYVRIPDRSDHGNYPADPNQMHFGLQLINPKYNYVYQLNGC